MRILLLITVIQIGLSTFAQQHTPENYIMQYKDIAIREAARSGVPASIILAQGILESGSGGSELALKSNNHFGIKCKSSWQGEKVYHDDDESQECFRKYGTVEGSYIDHSNFLLSNGRYAFLFNLEKTDYKGWAHGLKKAGYATNPQYAYKLINTIEKYNLNQFVTGNIKASNDSNAIENSIDKTQQNASNTAIKVEKENSNQNPDKKADEILGVEKSALLRPSKNYPQGVFKINETKVVFAKAGTSLLALSTEHDIALSRLIDFNDFVGEVEILEQDQLIFLQRKRKQGSQDYHTMQEGDDLHLIAQEYGIRLEALIELNNLLPFDKPAVGEKINLKVKATSKPKLTK
jgi:LysM repeat protein